MAVKYQYFHFLERRWVINGEILKKRANTGGDYMRRNLFLSFLTVLMIIFLISFIVNAEGVELGYYPLQVKLNYNTQILVENIINAGDTHISSSLLFNCLIENEISTADESLKMKTTFRDISLEDYNRELRVFDKVSHTTGLKDRKDIEIDLRNNVQNKWTYLIFNKKGIVLENYHSSGLDKINFFDMNQVAEQFFILLPDNKMEIGHQWIDTYTIAFPNYDQGQPFIGVVKYTYLGQMEHMGIQCYKIKGALYMEEERKIAEPYTGLTQISWIKMETFYFAVESNFLVESEISSDLTLLMIVNNEGKEEFRNFLENRMDYKIRLIHD